MSEFSSEGLLFYFRVKQFQDLVSGLQHTPKDTPTNNETTQTSQVPLENSAENSNSSANDVLPAAESALLDQLPHEVVQIDASGASSPKASVLTDEETNKDMSQDFRESFEAEVKVCNLNGNIILF